MGSGRVHTGSSDHLGAFGLARAALASSSRVIESPSHVMPADTQTAANRGPRSSIHTAGRVERPSQVLFIMGRDCCLPGRGRGRLESKLADAPSSRAHGSVPSSSSLLPTERRIPCSLFIPDAHGMHPPRQSCSDGFPTTSRSWTKRPRHCIVLTPHSTTTRLLQFPSCQSVVGMYSYLQLTGLHTHARFFALSAQFMYIN